jgi:hypothetical protein
MYSTVKGLLHDTERLVCVKYGTKTSQYYVTSGLFSFQSAYLVAHCSHMGFEGWSGCFQGLEHCSMVNLDWD